jgi:hypothetical protein
VLTLIGNRQSAIKIQAQLLLMHPQPMLSSTLCMAADPLMLGYECRTIFRTGNQVAGMTCDHASYHEGTSAWA